MQHDTLEQARGGCSPKMDGTRIGLPMVDLPDELLMKIFAHVPYRPRSHSRLPLVCRRFRSIMHTKSMPAAIAWSQFAPFMSLLEGYRGRSTTDFRRDELLQVWKSITMHRDWMTFLQDATGLGPQNCLRIVSVFHFIAAARQKCVQEADLKRVRYLFLAKVIQDLPPKAIILLRYIIRITIADMHDRHIPYDYLQHLRMQSGMNNPQDNDINGKKLSLNCLLESACLLLETYRPFYNIMADNTFYTLCMEAESVKAMSALDVLKNPSHASVGPRKRAQPLLGAFAMHVRLVQISCEGNHLPKLDLPSHPQMPKYVRLLVEHTKMMKIDAVIQNQFADRDYLQRTVQSLNLTGVGTVVKRIANEFETMDSATALRQQESTYEMYKLENWP